MSHAAVGRVLDALPIALLLLDEAGTIRTANPEAGRLLERDPASLTGTALFETIVAATGQDEAERTLCGRIEGGSLDQVFHALTRPRSGANAATLRVHLRSYTDDAGRHAAIALVERTTGLNAAARLSRAAEIASDVKHDVNSLLMGLLGHATLLGGRSELSDAARRKLALIEQQGSKIRDRIADLDAVRALADE